MAASSILERRVSLWFSFSVYRKALVSFLVLYWCYSVYSLRIFARYAADMKAPFISDLVRSDLGTYI
jgi:hypothetical protein